MTSGDRHPWWHELAKLSPTRLKQLPLTKRLLRQACGGRGTLAGELLAKLKGRTSQNLLY
jgi:hypothetical protein